jgi:hypothetical protein
LYLNIIYAQFVDFFPQIEFHHFKICLPYGEVSTMFKGRNSTTFMNNCCCGYAIWNTSHGNTLKSNNLKNSNFGLSFDNKVCIDFKFWIKFFSHVNIAPFSCTNIFTSKSCILIDRLWMYKITTKWVFCCSLHEIFNA